MTIDVALSMFWRLMLYHTYYFFMKAFSIQLFFFFATALVVSSCTKGENVPVKPLVRTIKFNLYTEQDFSAENGNITFSLLIRDGAKILLDSVVATMKVKDVPKLANKLTYEKSILYSNKELAVGFKYAIENVGYSWYIDVFKAGETSKELNFSFK
jgi:hypothetical protein